MLIVKVLVNVYLFDDGNLNRAIIACIEKILGHEWCFRNIGCVLRLGFSRGPTILSMSAQQTLMSASNEGSRKAVPRVVVEAIENGRVEGPVRRKGPKLLKCMAFTA